MPLALCQAALLPTVLSPAAFYLLLFVAPLAATLRTKLVEDLLGRYG